MITIPLLSIVVVMLLSVGNCSTPTITAPYMFKPPKWILGKWEDDKTQQFFIFYKNDILAGEENKENSQMFSTVYKKVKKTSDSSPNKKTYIIELINSKHIFVEKVSDKSLEYTYTIKNDGNSITKGPITYDKKN